MLFENFLLDLLHMQTSSNLMGCSTFAKPESMHDGRAKDQLLASNLKFAMDCKELPRFYLNQSEMCI